MTISKAADFSTADHYYMQRAIELAKKGRYTTTPNPNVGCVIVNQEQVVGEGYHVKAGTPHAEVHALCMAETRAQGATVYVTLEPCSHTGRTGPCADALIAAGVERVVVAMEDPNPQVSGRGIERIRKHGITVDIGLLREHAESLNSGFLCRMRKQKPFITLKLATSLDGRIALSNGDSQWITSRQARQDVQVHRAMSCAILSTAQTVLADNASLTVRVNDMPDNMAVEMDQPVRQPMRIILDQHHRLTGNEKLFQTSGAIVVVSHRTRSLALTGNVSELVVPLKGQQLDVEALLPLLSQQFDIHSLWVEAGALLAGSLLTLNCVDELILYQAPMLLGDRSKAMAILPEWQSLAHAKHFAMASVQTIGNDIKIRLMPKQQASATLD